MPDIDIDFADRDIILSQLEHRVAKLNTGKKHNTGVYATEIPHNPIDNLATVEHKAADERGYFKLDFLNVSIYKDVRDNEHLTQLMEREPLATSGTRRLQRSSLSSKRAQRTIETIEAQLGTTISSDTSDHSTGEETPSEQQLEFDFTRGVDEADGQ